MSVMACSGCGKLVDTDEFPESMYVTEEHGYKRANGQAYDCCCSPCFSIHEHAKG